MSLKKGLFLFLLLTAAVSGAILWSSIDRSSFDIFLNADMRLMGAAGLLVVGVWVLDALKLAELTRGAGCEMSFRFAIQLTWINYFGAALTPMQSGGGPFQMYLMYKHGISVGKTVAITLVRTIMTLLILGLSVPIAFLAGDELPFDDWKFKLLLLYISIFLATGGTAFVISIVRPYIIKAAIFRLLGWLGKIRLVRRERVARLQRRAIREIDEYSENIRSYLTDGLWHFIAAIVIGVLQMLTYLSVMPVMIMALGTPVSMSHCIIIQAIFIFTLFFMPTPGGSGAAEGGAALVASVFVPGNVAGMLGVGWRLLTEHTGILLGALTALRMIGWSLANEITAKREDEVEETAKREGKGH